MQYHYIWVEGIRIKLPLTEDNVKDKVTKFNNTFSVPQCLGADGTHIAIKTLL